MLSLCKPALLGGILLISFFAVSQKKSTLPFLKQQLQFTYTEQQNRIASFSKTNNVPLRLETGDGGHLLLVDVVNNIPVYISGLNNGAALTTHVTALTDGSSGIRLEGEGMLIGLWDEGSVKDHTEFGNRIISKEVNAPANHATHVMGTLIATGVNPSSRGMAPKANAANWYFDNDVAEMAAQVGPDQNTLLVSNHSYGTVTGWTKIAGNWHWSGDPSISGDEDYRFGFYAGKTAAIDALANLAPYYTIVWAAGNDRGEPGNGSRPPDCNGGTGYDCIIPEGTAKNILTIGAVNKMTTYTGPSSVVMSSFSSWGPTDDGRIKPDLVGAGVNLFSTSSIGENTYVNSSGTSMSTPNVSGSILLLQELYGKLHGGDRMKSSTLKALTIHTAREAGPLPGPDYSFGWGLLDTEAAAKLLLTQDDKNTIVINRTLSVGEVFELPITPQANQKITATLVWNDPTGTPANIALDPTKFMLVNDLDLRVRNVEDESLQYPWLLNPSAPSAQAIRGDNFRDNVEKIEFGFPLAKPYRITVSHKGELVAGPQDFSLIVTYKSASATGKTLYWIGDSGNWNDNTHWSLTSGGAPAMTIPGVQDVAIVDENSFDGVALDEILLTQSTSVNSLKWIRSSSATINFQGNTLTISKEVISTHASFTGTGNGTIRCTGPGGGLFFSGSDLETIAMVVESGNWKLRGSVHLSGLELAGGELTVENSNVTTLTLNSLGGLDRKLILTNSQIKLAGSNIDGDGLEINGSNASVLIQNSTANLIWSNLSWPAKLTIDQADVSITGTNTVGELEIRPGSILSLADGSVLTCNTISSLAGTASESVQLMSPGKATIDLPEHFLLCADYMSITNTDVTGKATINAGLNSTVTNSANWLTQACETVVFADFDEEYLCAGGFTGFMDKSSGTINSWLWDFGDPTGINNTSLEQNPFHEFKEPGLYTVSLTVTDGQQTNSLTKSVEIKSNDMSGNSIAVSEGQLVSLEIGSAYQWFFNEQKVEGATNRSLPFTGTEGLYRVVIYDEECNRSSTPVTITGEVGEREGIEVYPNPATTVLRVEGETSPMWISITNLLGQSVFQKWIDNKIEIPVSELNEGLYLVKVSTGRGETIKKILVKRN